jgi:hypothetical protein
MVNGCFDHYFLDLATKCTCDCPMMTKKLLHPFNGDQIGIVSLKLHEVKKRIMVSFLCYLFYALDFVSLVTPLQPLHRTSNDLRRLKS